MHSRRAAVADAHPRRAVVLAERGRAARLAEAIQQAALDLDRLDDAGAHDLRLRFEALRRGTVPRAGTN